MRANFAFEDQFVLSGNTVTISGLSPSETGVVVNTTLVKNGIQSKVKTYNTHACVWKSLGRRVRKNIQYTYMCNF